MINLIQEEKYTDVSTRGFVKNTQVIDFDIENNILKIFDRNNFFKLVNDNADFYYSDEGTLIEEGVGITPDEDSSLKFALDEMEEGIDYRLTILEVRFSTNFRQITEDRIILDFDPVEKFVIITHPFDTDFNTDAYDITYNVRRVDLEGIKDEKYMELSTGGGYQFSIEELRDGERGIKHRTPTNKFTMHESMEKLVEGERKSINDPYIEIISANYSQLLGKKDKIEYHEDRKPYIFGIYNQDYKDPETEEQHHNQGMLLQTPKHVLRFVDSSGLGDDKKAIKEGYLQYSSIDGNLLKLVANTSLGSALYFQTKEGHVLDFDDSNMLYQQFKGFDKETLKPTVEEQPVNVIKMDKTADAEMFVIESHQHGPEGENYEKILNKFVFSETPESAGILIQNTNDKAFNEIQTTAGDSQAQIIIGNSSDGKVLNTIFLDASDSGTFTLTNQFKDGKTNEIVMMEDSIKITDPESKNSIEITPKGIIIKSDNVNIPDPQKMVIGENLKEYLDTLIGYINSHTHVDPVSGSTGPPSLPSTPQLKPLESNPKKAYLSDVNKNN